MKGNRFILRIQVLHIHLKKKKKKTLRNIIKFFLKIDPDSEFTRRHVNNKNSLGIQTLLGNPKTA